MKRRRDKNASSFRLLQECKGAQTRNTKRKSDVSRIASEFLQIFVPFKVKCRSSPSVDRSGITTLLEYVIRERSVSRIEGPRAEGPKSTETRQDDYGRERAQSDNDPGPINPARIHLHPEEEHRTEGGRGGEARSRIKARINSWRIDRDTGCSLSLSPSLSL